MKENNSKKPLITPRRLLAGIVLVASLLFMTYTIYVGWQEVQNYEWQFDYFYLFLATVALILAFASNILGWELIIRALKGPHDFRKNARIYCLAAHGKRIPGLVWHVAGRAYLYKQEGIPAAKIVQGSLWEQLFQLTAGMAVYILFLPIYPRTRFTSPAYSLLIFIPLTLMLFPSVFKKLLRLLNRDQETTIIIPVRWTHKLTWFFNYFLGWLAGGSILYFLMKAVTSASFVVWPGCVGFVALSSALGVFAFFVPGGTGVREISLSLLLSSYIPLSVAVALAILFRIWILIGETALLFLLWGVLKGQWGFVRRLTQKDY